MIIKIQSTKGQKKPEVCRGCKYFQKRSETMALNNICRYMDLTGHSRLKVELENGGFKEDSCICYEREGQKEA